MTHTVRLLICIPQAMKRQLDGLKQEGLTTSGYIRRVIAADLQKRGGVRRRRRAA